MSKNGWTGVDLDGTLAQHGEYLGPGHIGAPIMPMVRRVKRWLAEGKEVRIFTARAWCPELPHYGSPNYADDMARRGHAAMAIRAIKLWSQEHIGQVLEVTCQKDFNMVALWDDRAIPVVFNQGFVRTLHADHDA